MRILVIARHAGRGALLVALAGIGGHGAVATDPDQLIAAGTAAEVLLIDAVDDPQQALRALERARAALEVRIPAVLVLNHGSAWLHGAIPPEMHPAVVLANAELAAMLDAALRRARAAPVRLATAGAAFRGLGGLTWLPESREVLGPRGRAVLTASEARVMEVLSSGTGRVVPAGAVSRALWGDVIVDRHVRAAIRSHVYTLRRKLRTAGLDGALISLPGLGYRLEPVEVIDVAERVELSTEEA